MAYSLQRFSFKAMGSNCDIQLFSDSRITAKQLAQALIDEIERLEAKYSRFRSDSLISFINTQSNHNLAIELDTETIALLDHALSCFKQSDELFDITAGCLSRLWDFKAATMPPPAAIADALNHVGLQKLSWENSTLKMPAGMELDFGGIVKEYAADCAATLARSRGCQAGLVNLGGDVAVIGPHPQTTVWPIGIVNPNDNDVVMAKLDLQFGGLASSGDYARYFVHAGNRYSHILNPKTGWPCRCLRAVSVAASLCTVAGSMATIAMLKDEQDAISWLEDSGVAFVYMTQAGVCGSGS